MSLERVSDYAAHAYQPGKERREPAAEVALKEAVISHFNGKAAEFGINVEM